MKMNNLVTDAPDIEVNDYITAKNMAESLHKYYPDHLWAVTCDGDRGIATVRNMALSGNWGFVLHLKDQYSASDWDKQLMRAGGELLERYRIYRGRSIPGQWEFVNTDAAGRAVADQ
jgi:hypothetical protein